MASRDKAIDVPCKEGERINDGDVEEEEEEGGGICLIGEARPPAGDMAELDDESPRFDENQEVRTG